MSSSALEEIEAIKRLKARYFRLLDTRQWDEWADVFTEDARLRWGPEEGDVLEGRPAIVAGVRASLEGATTVHHGHMPEIDLVGEERARGIWAMYDQVDAPGYRLDGYGHYQEEYRKQEGRWRIHRLHLVRLKVERVPKPA